MSRFTAIDERTGKPYTYIPFVYPSPDCYRATFLFSSNEVNARVDAEAQANHICTVLNKKLDHHEEPCSIVFLGTVPEFQEWSKQNYCTGDETFRERMKRNGEK